MRYCGLLLLLCVCTHGAPTEKVKPGSCTDPSVLGAAELAISKINQHRKEGYIYSLDRVCNVNQMHHGPTGVVFYLTLDVLETDCPILSKKDWKTCAARPSTGTPVYGQCKATVYINKVQRIARLYSYRCVLRPAPASKVYQTCPDCPSLMPLDSENVMKTVKQTLEEFNKKSSLSNYFALLNVTRASAQGGIAVFSFAEYTIQETTCSNSTDIKNAANCKLMDCEFAHKGFCKGTRGGPNFGDEHISVHCDIFEPEDAEKEKQRHLLGGEHGHSHDHAHGHDHHHTDDHTHGHDHPHTHDHTHEHDHNHDHTHGPDHTHNHDHTHGPDHHHGHDHTHEHNHTHEHLHLHVHEHHHHHHDHEHGHQTSSNAPTGIVIYLPSTDFPLVLPSFPDEPAASDPHRPVTLPAFPEEPTILPFPSTVSQQCPGEHKTPDNFIRKLFEEDPYFQHKSHKR